MPSLRLWAGNAGPRRGSCARADLLASTAFTACDLAPDLLEQTAGTPLTLFNFPLRRPFPPRRPVRSMVAHVQVGRARQRPWPGPWHQPVDTSRCCAVALRLAGRRSALLLAANHSLTWLAEQTRTLNFAAWAACGRPGYHRLRVAPAGSCRAEQHDDQDTARSNPMNSAVSRDRRTALDRLCDAQSGRWGNPFEPIVSVVRS